MVAGWPEATTIYRGPIYVRVCTYSVYVKKCYGDIGIDIEIDIGLGLEIKSDLSPASTNIVPRTRWLYRCQRCCCCC